MLFNDITIVDENMQAKEHMYVGVRNKVIEYIAPAPPADPAAFGRMYAGAGKMLIPGFYNAHAHSAMHLLRGYGENLPLKEWLHTKMFPFEAHLTPEDVFLGTMIGSAEMLRFGVVSTTDMYMQGGAMGRAFTESGLKANICVGVTCDDPRKDYRDTAHFTTTLMMRDKFHGADDGRILVDFAMHAEYTTTAKIARSVAREAAAEEANIHAHVAETAAEVAECRARHLGRTPVQYLADCGIFDRPCVAAHCVHLTADDIAILKEKNVSVASCPKSNMKLASGFCPVGELLAAGINVALGTDSVASNNNLNMLEEAKVFALVHKAVSGDPTLITPQQALYAATRAGALAQGRQDCGLVKQGFRADLAVLDIDRMYMRPAHDLVTNLIYSACGSDVCLTMVDGRVLYEDGCFPHMDLPDLLERADVSCARILAALAAEGRG